MLSLPANQLLTKMQLIFLVFFKGASALSDCTLREFEQSNTVEDLTATLPAFVAQCQAGEYAHLVRYVFTYVYSNNYAGFETPRAGQTWINGIESSQYVAANDTSRTIGPNMSGTAEDFYVGYRELAGTLSAGEVTAGNYVLTRNARVTCCKR